MDTQPKKGLHPLLWVGIGCGCLVLIGVGFVVAGTGFLAFKAKEAVEDFQANPEETTAKLIAFANPDIDLVKTDNEAGTVTFRNTKDGKEFTVDYEDLKDGKLTIQGPDGEITFDANQTEDGGTLTIQGPDGETRINLEGGEGGEGGQLTVQGPDGEARYGVGQGLDDVPGWVPLYPEATSSESNFASSGSEGEAGFLSFKTDETTEAVMEYYKEKLADEGYEVTHQTTNLGDQGTHGTVSGSKDGQTVNVVVTHAQGETGIVLQYNRKTP